MKRYTVKELAKLAQVSIRTLHHYDGIGLLKPAFRSEKKYRLYGKNELLRLQQILFYKELGLSLKAISEVLDDKNFNHIAALENQRSSLLSEQKRITILLKTIDKTILKLKGKKMITDKELYAGFSKEEVSSMRTKSKKKFGEAEVQRSEKYLKSLSKEAFKQLQNEQSEIFKNLLALSKEDVASEVVQLEISKHYTNTRKFWGTNGTADTQKSDYKGLGKLYTAEESYCQIDGKHYAGLAKFISAAIQHFAKTQL